LYEYLGHHVGHDICPTKTQRYIDRLCKKKSKYTKGTLLACMTDYIDSKIHVVNSSTLRRYHVFSKLIARFDGYSMKNHTLKEVNASYVRHFLQFGIAEGYSSSTLYRTIHFVRTILRFLDRRGIRTYSYELDLPKISAKKVITTLSEKELTCITQTPVCSSLQAAKDWLIISC